jgi:hypothetical protein
MLKPNNCSLRVKILLPSVHIHKDRPRILLFRGPSAAIYPAAENLR